MITVLVGPKEVPFDLHKEHVCAWSDFFKTACNSNFKERNGVVNFPEQDPDTFRYFVYWLYTGKLCGFVHPESTMKTMEAAVIQDLRADGKKPLLRLRHNLDHKSAANRALSSAYFQDAPFTELISLYILADQLQVRGLKDTIVNLIIDVYSYDDMSCLFWSQNVVREPSTWIPEPAIGINLAWQSLPDSSPLRSLLLQLFCDNADRQNNIRGLYTTDFLAEAFTLAAARTEDDLGLIKWEKKGEKCKHHVHDVECPLAIKSKPGQEPDDASSSLGKRRASKSSSSP